MRYLRKLNFYKETLECKALALLPRHSVLRNERIKSGKPKGSHSKFL
jgi:hypothetical protein